MKSIPCALQIHKDGYLFVIIFIIATILMGLISSALCLLGVFLTLWCIYFFRNPERMVPDSENYIVSPADGVVSQIIESPLPAELNAGTGKVIRISVFLSIFNAHVNRVPAYGKIVKIHYHPGKFINASLDKASIHNEKNHVLMKLKVNGKPLIFTQIAGLIARRIVCDLKEGQEVSVGERYGIIRFGSRMDIYLPKGESPIVSVGQQVIAGETILAKIGSKEVVKGVIR